MEEQNKKEYLDSISEIKSLMEKSSRFLSLSGLSGVVAGLTALAGSALAYFYFDGKLFNSDFIINILRSDYIELTNSITFLLTDAIVVLIVAFAGAIYFTNRKAKKDAVKAWDKSAKRTLINLAIPLVTGGLFSLVLAYHLQISLIAPSTLIFYGLALINAGKYTVKDIRVLGILEIILGLAASFFTGYGLILWIIGFGILHILYGIIMYVKYERK